MQTSNTASWRRIGCSSEIFAYYTIFVRRGSHLTEGCGEAGLPHAPDPQGHGETGFPHPPTRWEDLGGRSPRGGVWGSRVAPRPRPAGGWGNPVSPSPHPVGGSGRAQPSRRGVGKPGCPTPPPRRGMGKPGFPMPPPAGGSGRATPSQEQSYVHPVGVRRSRMDGGSVNQLYEESNPCDCCF